MSIPLPSSAIRPLRFGMLSTYPPKLCGLATFAAALGAALIDQGHEINAVRIDDGDGGVTGGGGFATTLVNGNATSIGEVAGVLSVNDIAVIQHEYGIFGGPDGDEVLDLLRALTVPALVVLHTVPLHPTAHQREVLETITRLADGTVVMSEAARSRLVAGYDVDDRWIFSIPHGASLPDLADQAGAPGLPGGPQLLTWGLLGPGKGIEHAIDALTMCGDHTARPHYTVAGVTHPKVRVREGDRYRQSLIDRARRCWMSRSITFDDNYRTLAELTRFVASASVVILPYDSRDQVTSGVLVDAIAAGRPVIATAFPHAVELLGSGAGVVVPHEDPVALAAAISWVVADPAAWASMSAQCNRLARSLSWRAVARQYAGLATDLVRTGTGVSS
jgi:glycosyltransferase involved in cell wall biosynthesis